MALATTKLNYSLLLLTLSTLLFQHNAFGGVGDCLNPSKVSLPSQSGEDVDFHFCEIPAAQNVKVGKIPRGLNSESKPRTRDFDSFQISQFEVSQSQYQNIMGRHPWISGKYVQETEDGVKLGENSPATYLSYQEALQFVLVLNVLDEEADYRLLSTDEFEYATLAGQKTRYAWGDQADSNFVYFFNYYQNAQPVDSCPTSELNSLRPGYCTNDFGLYHMWGNVEEWTSDVSPEGLVALSCGWNWQSPERFYSQSICRNPGAETKSKEIGFRVVRTQKVPGSQ